MNMWQKLTIDWPCALGDWLWANVWMPLTTLPRQLTWRRVVFLAAFLVAAWAMLQLFSIDMAFLMAGDIAFYCELLSAVALIVVRGRIRHVADMARLVLIHAARRATGWLRGARRPRSARKPVARDAGSDDDGAAGWLGCGTVAA